jgi:translocation and assembly module TamA
VLLAAAAAPAHADIKIHISGVEGALRDNVLAYLSLQRFAKRDDLDAAMIDRLFQRATGEAQSALRPYGYYEPRVHGQLRADGKDWRVDLRIEPGTPVVVASAKVTIAGPGTEDASLKHVLEQSTLAPGTRLNHVEYERTKGELQRTAVAIGYLDARLAISELLVDPAAHTASIVLELDTGPRYRFGKTSIEQNTIDQRLFIKYLRYRENDYYSAAAVLSTQFALDDSEYFSLVQVSPGKRDPTTLTVPIDIRAGTARRDRYEIGFGYGTDTKFRTTLSWDDRRINSAGHHSRIAIKASSVTQELTGRYLIPVGDPALEQLSFDAKVSKEKLADVDTSTVELRPGLTQALGRWQRVLFIRFDNTTSATPTSTTTANLVIPGISIAPLVNRTLSESLLGRGFYAELTGSHHVLGSDADYLRLDVQSEKAFNLSPKWRLLTRGELGLSLVADFSELPASERFFAGGDRSVRGFGLNELSPVDENGNKVGGRHLIVGSLEIERELSTRYAVAAFVDAGNAINRIGDPLEYSVGIGFRWKIPVMSIGFDVAQALSQKDLAPRLHLNITPNLK